MRNQFQALATSSNEDIETTIKNWNSDFGDAGISNMKETIEQILIENIPDVICKFYGDS